MNFCFVMGEIISEIKFDFVIDNKTIGSNVSVVRFCIDVFGEKINVIGYNNIADWCYSKLEESDNVFIEGSISTKGKIEIENISLIKILNKSG